MEANIPSKLGVADHGSACGVGSSTELDDPLVCVCGGLCRGKRELVATILEVLGVGVVERALLSLSVAIHLQWI